MGSLVTSLNVINLSCLCHVTVSAKECFMAFQLRPPRSILLPRYFINGLSNLDKTYRQYSLAPTDDLIRFCRSKAKVTAGRRSGEGIHVDTGASKSIFQSLVVVYFWSWTSSSVSWNFFGGAGTSFNRMHIGLTQNPDGVAWRRWFRRTTSKSAECRSRVIGLEGTSA